MTEDSIRVVIVDDHAMVREGLRALLDARPDIEVVGEASNGEEAIEAARQYQPDVILMDVTMPGMNGIESTRAIGALGISARVLGLTVHENQEYFFQMLAAGASGYLLKGAGSRELVDAIHSVHRGGVSLTPMLAGHMVNEFLQLQDTALMVGEKGLTPRELDVFRAIARGLTNKEIGEEFQLSVYTIQTHRASIMRKLNLENRHQLMRFAIVKGYVADSG